MINNVSGQLYTKINTAIKHKQGLFNFLIVLLCLALIGAIAKVILVKYFDNDSQSKLSYSAKVTPTPAKKIVPIFQGKGTYNISQGKTNGPKISKAIIDPHDAQVGSTQTITIFAKHTSPVGSIKVTLKSDDNQEDVYDLSLTEGTALEGQWTGSWKVENTHLYNYVFVIIASDGTNNSRAGVAIR